MYIHVYILLYKFNVRYAAQRWCHRRSIVRLVLLRDALCSFHGLRPDANPGPLDLKSRSPGFESGRRP